MRVVLTLLAGCVVVVALVGTLVFAVRGIAGLVASMPPIRARLSAPPLSTTAVCLVSAAMLAALPVLRGAHRRGVHRLGRPGRRRDALDGFSNGAYDWVDVNAGAWIRAWGLMAGVVLAGSVGALRFARARAARSAGGRRDARPAESPPRNPGTRGSRGFTVRGAVLGALRSEVDAAAGARRPDRVASAGEGR
jgi:hypothetical protein